MDKQESGSASSTKKMPEPTTDTALVTGAAGFVGRRLAERLVAAGYTVIASDLRDPQIAGAHFAPCDITDPAACHKLTEGVTAVFHVASMVQTRRSGAAPV